MPNVLYAGAARRIINPKLGTKRPGLRLFADPLQAVESDLSATAVVLSNQGSKVVIVGIDICVVYLPVAMDIRRRIGAAVGTPASHVLINFNHTHSGPALPDFLPDSPEQLRIQTTYQERLFDWLVEAAVEADRSLRPARIGAGWGEADIGIYRRETGSRRPGRVGGGSQRTHRFGCRRPQNRRPGGPAHRHLFQLRLPHRDHGTPLVGGLLRFSRSGSRPGRRQSGRIVRLPAGLRRKRQSRPWNRLRGGLPGHQESDRPDSGCGSGQGGRQHPHQRPARETEAAHGGDSQYPVLAVGTGRGRHVDLSGAPSKRSSSWNSWICRRWRKPRPSLMNGGGSWPTPGPATPGHGRSAWRCALPTGPKNWSRPCKRGIRRWTRLSRQFASTTSLWPASVLKPSFKPDRK